MAYSIWDKQPELILPKIPFEVLAGLAEKRDKQLDEVDTKIGELKGKFASLVAAPGHEDLATGLTTEYNTKVNEWYEKYKTNPLSREGSRELASLASQFANDQKVQTVVKSRQFYEKFEPKMWEEMSKRSYIDAPGILNPDGTFNQNTQTYDMSKFQLTPQADYIKSIQQQYDIKKEAKFQSSKTQPLGVDAEGHPIYKTEDYQRIWNDPENRKETALAIEKMVWDNTTSDAGLIYLRKTAERQHPGDLEAQKEFVRESIRNAGVPFDFDWEETKESTKIDTTGTTKPKKGDEPTAPPGITSTVSLDLLADPVTGQPLKTAGALDQAVQNLTTQITTLKGGIKNDYPGIAQMEAAGEKPYVIDNTSGFEVIDISKVAKKLNIENDPIAMAQLSEKNIQLMNAQVRRNGYYEKQAEFMDKAGLNANENLDDQVTPQLKETAHQDAIYETVNNLPTFWGLPDPFDSRYVEKSVNSLTGTTNDISKSFLNPDGSVNTQGKPIRTKQDLEDHFQAYYKMLEKSKFAPEYAKRKDALELQKNKFLNDYVTAKDTYYKNNDPRYKTYAELVEKDLETAVNQQAFNYFISGEAYTNLKRMAIAAAQDGKFDRAKWDENKPAFKYMDKGEKEREKVLPQKNMKLWEDATYSIRYDSDTDDWVVDAVTSEGVFEIPNVENVASYVAEMDPVFTNKYLTQQQSFFSQMDQSNGRYAAIASPSPTATDYIVVKSATEDHGDIGRGDYVFMLPEFPDKVFTTKTFFHLNQVMQYYNTLKEAGMSSDKINAELALRKQNGLATFNAVPSNYASIKSKYFSTPGSRGYSVKK